MSNDFQTKAVLEIFENNHKTFASNSEFSEVSANYEN